jgi:PAS domain S-box-containing protein
VDTDFRVLYQNRAHREILGDHRGELCYSGYRGRDRVCEDCPLELCFKDGNVHAMEVENRREKGTSYYEITSAALRNLSGEIVAGVQVQKEVTDKKNTNEALHKTTESLRALIQASPLAIIALDPDGRVTMWNPAAERTFGWGEREAIGRLNPIVPEDRMEEFHWLRERVLTGEGFTGVEVQRRRKDGSTVDIRIATSPLYGASRNITGIMALCEDITAQKQMEEQMLQSKQDWEETFDTITDMITIHDADFNIIRANRAARAVLGLPGAEAAQLKCFKYYHGSECPPEGCPSCLSYKTKEPALTEVFEPHLNAFIEIRSIPRLDERKQMTGLIHIVRDITEKKKAEEKVKRHLNYINALRTVDMAITSSLDLCITLNIFIEQVVTHLGVDAARVLLVNPHTQTLEFSAGSGFEEEELKGPAMRLGQGLAGRAALLRRTVIINDLSNPPESEGWITEDGIKGPGAYFCIPLIVKGQVKGVLELFHSSPLEPEQEWLEFLNALAGQAGVAIDNSLMFEELLRSHNELISAYDTTIEGWSRALDYRDKETEGHSQRVTEMTLRIAREMGIKEEELVHIRRGALLHDIGKLGVPDAILFKAEGLSPDEWELMKRHPVIAYELLSPIPFLRQALDIPFCHHEKWDGTGYPMGLNGEQIPLPARIFAVVDVWDALCSDRPYRKAWPREEAVEHVRSLVGAHFDPEVVDLFLKMEW